MIEEHKSSRRVPIKHDSDDDILHSMEGYEWQNAFEEEKKHDVEDFGPVMKKVIKRRSSSEIYDFILNNKFDFDTG